MEYIQVINEIDQLVTMRLMYIKDDHADVGTEKLGQIENSLPGYFERHLGKDLFAFAAVDGGVIVSTAFLLIIEKPSNANFPTGRIGNVLNVYTRESYRRRGIATKVMNMLLSFAKEEKLDFVELDATEDGYPLYKKLGFIEKKSSYTAMRYYFK